MERIAESFADFVMGRGPLAWFGRRRHRRDLVVLAYHDVDNRPAFANQLDHLMKYFQVVSIDDVLAALDGAPLPLRAALITFDDGERTVLTDGLPELRRRRLPSVLFAISKFIDTKDAFWWREVEEYVGRGGRSELLGDANGDRAVLRQMKLMSNEDRLDVLAQLKASSNSGEVIQDQLTSEELRLLEEGGMTVENHSFSHPLLDRCSDETIKHEISAGADGLEQIMGRPMRVFAYPNGNVDERVVAAARDRGHAGSFLFDHRVSEWPPSDPMLISRVRVNSATTLNRFAAIVSGVHPAYHAFRDRP